MYRGTIPPTYHYTHLLVSCNGPFSVYPTRLSGFLTTFLPPIRQKGAQHGFQPPLGASELSTPHSFARQIAQTWVLRPYHPEDGTPPQIRYQGS